LRQQLNKEQQQHDHSPPHSQQIWTDKRGLDRCIRSSLVAKEEWLWLGDAAYEVKDLPLFFFRSLLLLIQDIHEVALGSAQRTTNRRLGSPVLHQL